MKIKFIFNLFFLSISLQLFSQEPVFSWVKQSTSTVNDSRVLPYSASVDKQKNNIVIGIFYQNTTFGSESLVSDGAYNSFISKIDSQGNFIWSKQLSSSAHYVSSNGVSTDNSGNIYIVGNFTGTVAFGSISLSTNNDSHTSFVAKIDSSGNFIWAKKIDNSDAGCIKVDSQGNIIVFGKFSGQIVLDNFNLNGYDDYYITKLNSTGNAIWLKGIQNPGQNFSYKSAISIDPSDYIYIASSYRDILYFDSIQINSSNPSSDDIFVCKMNTDGNFLWARSAGGVGSDLAQGIGVDGTGNVYISGVSTSSSVIFGSLSITNHGGSDLFLSKLNNNGDFVWANSYGTTGDEMLWSQVTDKSGNSYLSADSNDVNYYSFLIKYDNNGNFNLNKKLTNSFTECLALDTDDNLFISGTFGDNYNLDGVQLTSNSNNQEVAYFGKINSILSVQEKNKIDIQIYPNPTKDILNIETKNNLLFDVTFYDISGKKITSKKNACSKTSIDLSSFEKGNYIIEIKTGDRIISKNIIKI